MLSANAYKKEQVFFLAHKYDLSGVLSSRESSDAIEKITPGALLRALLTHGSNDYRPNLY
jgi:hypothetical protein